MRTSSVIGLVVQVALVSFVLAQEEPTEAELGFSASIISNTSDSSSGEDVLLGAMFAHIPPCWG